MCRKSQTEHSQSSSRDVLTLWEAKAPNFSKTSWMVQMLLQAPVPFSVALGPAGSQAGYWIENKGLFLLGYGAN